MRAAHYCPKGCLHAVLLAVCSTVVLTSEVARGSSRTAVSGDAAPDTHGEHLEHCLGPHVPVFHMVLKTDETKFFKDGHATPTGQPMRELTKLRSCARLEDKSCCTDDYFKQVDQIFARETMRLALVRDVYSYLVSDSIQPAIAALLTAGNNELADRAKAQREILEAPDAAHSIVNYIDGCEEVIQKYFSAALCALCDPQLDRKLTEDRYLVISDKACDIVHKPCANMPAKLQNAAQKFEQAGKEFAAIDQELPSDRKLSEVTRASTELSNLATLVEITSTRIDYYKDENAFCKKLNEEGYVYRPQAWGNVDLMHPSSSRFLERLKSRVQIRTLLDRMRAQKQDEDGRFSNEDSLGSPEPLRVGGIKYGVKEPTRCVNGALIDGVSGKECKCEDCWSGNTCEVKVRVKPFLKQPFTPLTAKEQLIPQSILVGGCEMPTEIDSHFAHIKIVDPSPMTLDESAKLARAGLDTKDLCVVRKGAPPFREVIYQVPVTVKRDALEYLVHVRHSETGEQPLPAYVVCFCFGPECFEDPPSWYTIGMIDVVPGGRMEKEDSLINEGHGYGGPPHYANERPCGQQWLPAMDGHGIKLAPGIDRSLMTFECMDENFGDMAGPRWIRCIDGEWFCDDANINPEQSELRTHWDGQLPTCRWKWDNCPEPATKLDGGFVTIENGLARYVCQPSRIMYVEGKVWQAATYVRWCRPTGSWLPAEEPKCVRDTTPQVMPSTRKEAGLLHTPKDGKSEAMTALSFLEVSAEAQTTRHHGQHQRTSATGQSSKQGSTSTARAAARAALQDGVRTKITSAEITGAGPPETIAAQQGFAIGGVTAAPVNVLTSEIDGGAGTERSDGHLKLHPWKTRFEKTQDAEHSLMIDKCWITLDCSGGQVPDDAAASPRFARKSDSAAGRLPWSVILAAAASVVVSMVAMAAIAKSDGAQQHRELTSPVDT